MHARENPYTTKLPFKEGIIHYSISGNTKGTQTMYVRNFGKERVLYKNSESKIMQKKASADTLIMIDEKWTYHINLSTKEATKEPSLNRLLQEQYALLNKEEQKYIQGKIGKTFLGFACRKESLDGRTSYFTKKGNILLFSEAAIMGYKVKTVATKIENTPVKASLFELPKGLKIVEKKADTLKAEKIIKALLKQESFVSKKTDIDYNKIIQDGINSLDF